MDDRPDRGLAVVVMRERLVLVSALILSAVAPLPVLARQDVEARLCVKCDGSVPLVDLEAGSEEARAVLLTFGEATRPLDSDAPPDAQLSPTRTECAKVALIAGAGTAAIGAFLAWVVGGYVDGLLPSEGDTAKDYWLAGGVGFAVGATTAAVYCGVQRRQ